MSSNDDKKTDLVKAENQFKDIASLAASLPEDLCDPSSKCKVCKSQYRAEINDLYRKFKKNATQIHKWLVEEKKETDISYHSVNNHVNNHIKQEDDAVNLKEFGSELQKWGQLSSTDEELLKRYIKMLDREATLLLARNNNELPIHEVRKNIETSTKVAQLIGYYQERLEQIGKAKHPVELIVMTIHRIIKFRLDSTKNDEVKKVLEDVWDQLAKEVSDINIDTVEN